MLAPYGLNILDNCMTCPVRGQHLFCNLPSSAAEKLNDITSSAVYPRNAILFIEGQQARSENRKQLATGSFTSQGPSL
jgi:hypothetical protein